MSGNLRRGAAMIRRRGRGLMVHAGRWEFHPEDHEQRIEARDDGAGPMDCGERGVMEDCNAMGSEKSRRLVSSAQTDRFLIVSRRSMTISFTLLSACVVSSFTNVGATAYLEAKAPPFPIQID